MKKLKLSILVLMLLLFSVSCSMEGGMTELAIFAELEGENAKTLVPVYNEVEKWVLVIYRITGVDEHGDDTKEQYGDTIEKHGKLWKCDPITIPFGTYEFYVQAFNGNGDRYGKNTLKKTLSTSKDSIEVTLEEEKIDGKVVGGELYIPIQLDYEKAPKSTLTISKVSLTKVFSEEGTEVSYLWVDGGTENTLVLETSATDTNAFVLRNAEKIKDEDGNLVDGRLEPGIYRMAVTYHIKDNSASTDWSNNHVYRENVIVRSKQVTMYTSILDEENVESLEETKILLYDQEDDANYEDLYFTLDHYEDNTSKDTPRVYRNGIKLKGAFNDKVKGELTVPIYPITTVKGKNYHYQIAMGGFINCFYLTDIYLPLAELKNAGMGFFSIGDSAFQNCFELKSIELPETMERTKNVDLDPSIGEKCFKNCASLKTIAIPSGIKTIKSETFYGCESLVSIYIPATVTSIVSDAFTGCDSLKDIYFEGTADAWKKINSNFSSTVTVHCGATRDTYKSSLNSGN